MDKRIKNINKLLSEYAAGHFEKTVPVSGRRDKIDAVASGINMLGEELEAATISRNYFNNIFNSVSDMIFILDKNKRIQDINRTVSEYLGYNRDELIGRLFSSLKVTDKPLIPSQLLKQAETQDNVVTLNTYFKKKEIGEIPVQVWVTALKEASQGKKTILLTAKDRTQQVQNENIIIRTIVNTQEKERKRLADDLHDSMQQKLTAIMFHLAAMAENYEEKEQQLQLVKYIDALNAIIAEMRNICFNLLPASLTDFGLVQTVRGLCRQPEYDGMITFKITEGQDFPQLSGELGMSIFRVIQEFITNAATHGLAEKITFDFRYEKDSDTINILLKDDGTGFNTDKTHSNGRGLANARSRIRSQGGELDISSIPGKGTTYKLKIPLNINVREI